MPPKRRHLNEPLTNVKTNQIREAKRLAKLRLEKELIKKRALLAKQKRK